MSRRNSDVLPPGIEDHPVCSEPFRKFSILTDSSRASQICVLTGSDWIRRCMSIELSRFYHGKIYRRLVRFLLSKYQGASRAAERFRGGSPSSSNAGKFSRKALQSHWDMSVRQWAVNFETIQSIQSP
jgi:hypothetical protein